MKINYLPSAVDELPEETVMGSDQLPLRESGSWALEKHKYLSYYSQIFNEAMKGRWENRIYIEYFAGPGRCHIRADGTETDGSVLRALEADYTQFIFIEMCKPLAEALHKRLANHPKKDLIQIWVGDCNEALDKIMLPRRSLSLAFIDPTRIGHCPFDLIRKTRLKSPYIDLLINIPAMMDIKRNIQNYSNQQGPEALLTRYVGSEAWRNFPQHDPKAFCRQVIELFETQLKSMNWKAIGKMQQIRREDNLPLYYLFFASAHRTGQKFWNDTLKYCNPPELELLL